MRLESPQENETRQDEGNEKTEILIGDVVHIVRVRQSQSTRKRRCRKIRVQKELAVGII